MQDEDNRYDDIPEECFCEECGSLIKNNSYSDEGTGHNTVVETDCDCNPSLHE